MENLARLHLWIPSNPDESRGSLFVGKQCEQSGRTQDRTCLLALPTLRLPSLQYGRTIVSLSQQGRKETTSTEVFLVQFLRLTDMSTAARTLVGGGRGFHHQKPEKDCSRTMAMKPGQSSKPEALIGLEDLGGSKNSPLGAENWWIER